ncbi:MAG: purine-nucleoside phosphorylase [Clostridiales bacterium]|jgi:purine-nucleoside phosphorylase|nr:purine-nucleoside phosphorylase [Clostridiales bacterium]
MSDYQALTRALSCIKSALGEKRDFKPRVALILGSGLGDFADNIDVVAKVEYSQIDGFPVSTVPGHKGRYIFGYINNVPLVCMQGRVHYYEGYSMQQVVMPVRLMGMLGAEILLITNAAGGINRDFYPGALMLIRGHISCFVPSPLIGPNIDRLGTRFPDMTNVYDSRLASIIESAAQRRGVELEKGVYVQLGGPNFETPEEIKMLELLGADAVGMSSACEAIAARHMGMRVAGISCISNLAAGITGEPLTHQEVIDAASEAAPKFTGLLIESISKM